MCIVINKLKGGNPRKITHLPERHNFTVLYTNLVLPNRQIVLFTIYMLLGLNLTNYVIFCFAVQYA